ncbi:hypothetical protein [Corallococcus exercitus]|uniref:hypothetical protein n=1 Tax=Corallococcus exercitus TaxID=2316736 RepID=UPI0035D47694
MSRPSLPAALLLFLLASTVARADDAAPLHGPWFGVSLMRSSGFDTTVRDPAPIYLQTVRYDDGVGLGVRAGYDFQALVGAYLAAELLTGREDIFFTSLGGGLRVLTPTAPFRVGFSAGVRFIDSDPSLPFFTTGLMGEARPWRHVGIGLEVDKAWPLRREIIQERNGGTHQRSTTVEGGPWRLVLGLTWYF